VRHAEAYAPRAGVPRLTVSVVYQRLLVTAARSGARIDGVSGPGPAGVALEGPGTFVSKPLPGASCVRKVPRHGASMDDHQRLGAALLHPAKRAVMPRMSAPIGTHEGTGQYAGERQVATRFLVPWRQDHPPPVPQHR